MNKIDLNSIKILSSIEVDMIQYDIFIGMNCTYTEFAKYINKRIKNKVEKECLIKEEYRTSLATTIFNITTKGVICGMWFKKYDFNIFDESILTHEIIHLIDFISEDKGFMDEKEFRAYLGEHITYQVKKLHLDRYNKLKKCQKKTLKKQS